MVTIKYFKDINKKDTFLAGGKGASLGEMTKAGISIPPGFVLLSTAFESFLRDENLSEKIEKILEMVNHKKIATVDLASKRIQRLILDAPFPENITKDIDNNFAKLKSKYIAIRSSATAEDSADSAWAGQLESYLNTDKDNLLINIKKCWASLFSPRAIYYRFENKLDKKKISVAVVVQKMLKSSESGIAFSVHPVTQNRNRIIIEAGFGLGESIVSGQITPDSYVVSKNSSLILNKIVSIQTKLMTRSKNGGNEWQKVPLKKQSVQKLSDDEIFELTEIIKKIEYHYGFPCDIEWARENGKFFITQSRPITTLKGLEEKDTISNYIEHQDWFFGARADESLFFFSAKQIGCKKNIKKNYGIDFTEAFLISKNNNYPIRAINLEQNEIFLEASKKYILKKPKTILSFIKKNNLVYKGIEECCKELTISIEKDQLNKSIKLFNTITNHYEMAGALYVIIFSLGMKLTENKNKLKGIKRILKEHDFWRNNIALKEEEMGEFIFYFFKYFLRRKKLKTTPSLLMKFLTLTEIKEWLKGQKKDEEIKISIETRKKHGYIYSCLRKKDQEFIDEYKDIKKIRKHFSKLDNKINNSTDTDGLKGQIAFSSKRKIRGKIIIIKDKSELTKKGAFVEGKILIAVQTTPQYIPYIKKIKAIITDEGGITCHAAIIAREFKIPCIVGTKNATKLLKDGDTVVINTSTGTIINLKQ